MRETMMFGFDTAIVRERAKRLQSDETHEKETSLACRRKPTLWRTSSPRSRKKQNPARSEGLLVAQPGQQKFSLSLPSFPSTSHVIRYSIEFDREKGKLEMS
jgi:hypothetical protein